jgi:low temperature requirement protein LtrA
MERRTSPVELLWDLVFVFAVTQVTALLAHSLSWAGFGRSMLVLALVWWAWSAFVWAANAQDTAAPVLRMALLLAMVLIFITGLAIPGAFGDESTLFAVTYAGGSCTSRSTRTRRGAATPRGPRSRVSP